MPGTIDGSDTTVEPAMRITTSRSLRRMGASLGGWTTIGPQYVFVLAGGSREHFWFGNFYRGVAPYDYNIVTNWNWDGDQVVIYNDSDHVGWYFAYNPPPARLVTKYGHLTISGRGRSPFEDSQRKAKRCARMLLPNSRAYVHG
jgi:hypothetical protein